LTHPRERWPGRPRRRWWLAVAVVYLLIEIPLVALNGPLTTPSASGGMVSLQLAGTPEKAERIVGEWRQAEALDEAGLSLGFDFLAMPYYAVSFAGLVIAAVTRARARGWLGVAALGALLAWFPFAAVVLDSVETGSQAFMIDDPPGWPAVVRTASLGKFSLLSAALVFAIGIGAATALARRRPAHHDHG
jgi:hypothetical protein